ncbi:glycosyltransferase [Mangrovibacterium lignilyticum]|uniref:glycosyltransferase n=1 Tax=Mangrovibacterium lignilyticum TaxID=2668052 RepID=UPI0013D23711|nr:glycosyltransferase [Mangrovibacterium lignilyticum]
MRVLHIIATLDQSGGGPSLSVPSTCIQLAKLGVSVEIICRPSKSPVTVPEVENLKVRFLNITRLIHLAKKLKKEDVDLIHLQQIWDPYIHIMAYAARIKQIPYLITPRGMLEPWILNRHPLKKKLAMLLYQDEDIKQSIAIHTTCQKEKENIQAIGYQNRTIVIPNGLDMEKVTQTKEFYGTKKLIFLSRIHEKKGIEILLSAWDELDHQGWTLEIAGEGDPNYVEYLKRKIEQKPTKNAFLVGPKYGKEKWKFLTSGDVFVLPTHSENFGNVVIESLSVGVPVITTTGTPWEELRTHDCGWWIELETAKLKSAIEEAINTDNDKLKQMGRNGLELVHQKYNIESIGKRIQIMYTELLSPKN